MSDYARRRGELESKVYGKLEASDRYVDTSARITVIRAAEPGEVSFTLDGGRDVVAVGDPVYCGGWLDTAASPPRLVERYDGSREPAVSWSCSEDQWKLIEHPDSDPVGKLAVGGMGAGKTTAGIIWVYWRWQESIGTMLEGGVTAPTETRLSLVFNEIFRMFPPQWWRFRSSENVLTMCDGFRIRGVSTYQQSSAQGSRIQGFNWIWWLGDELQDQVDQYVHILARLRSKADGRAKRLGTATAKDDPRWRTFSDEALKSDLWLPYTLLGPSSPFVHPNHWDGMKRSMTERDYRRLVMAEDMPSESRLYNTFDRRENVRPIPLGARKITSIVLARRTNDRRDALLMGHDPGAAKAATVWLDAYEIPQRKGEVLWWVRDELFTLQRSTEEHATAAMRKTRERFGVNMRADEERAHVRCQPLGAAEDRPSSSTFGIWQRIGFHIKWAHYNAQGKGGQIKKEDRIGMVNSLFCNAEGKRRLFIECDDRGTSPCKDLIAALEVMERDHMGRPEHEEKDVRYDKSDLPAALGYALYPFEKELASALRADIKRAL